MENHTVEIHDSRYLRKSKAKQHASNNLGPNHLLIDFVKTNFPNMSILIG